jgi:D-sedoheptulose 7-phosphate isomerase
VSFSKTFLDQVTECVQIISIEQIEKLATSLGKVRDGGGRLFILGLGGSAGHATHAVNDFRKLCNFESYTPTDNVSELTARINDDGWESSLANWLRGSRINAEDAVLIFSVGGGNKERNVSVSLINAIDVALEVGAGVFGIIGRDGGYTAKVSHAAVVIPTVNEAMVTPITEGLCAVVWHALVSHPALKKNATKW